MIDDLRYVWSMIDLTQVPAHSIYRQGEWYESVPWEQSIEIAKLLVVVGTDYEPPNILQPNLVLGESRHVAEGVVSLLQWPIEASTHQITDGGHRIAAMRNQGIRYVLGIRIEPADV